MSDTIVATTPEVKVVVASTPSIKESLLQAAPAVTVETLRKDGIFNATELYTLFNKDWEDPFTKKLINRNYFFQILRDTFQVKNSSRDVPVLKNKALRNKAADVYVVKCPKHKDPSVVGVELRPAHESHPDAHVRTQIRYKAPALDYLKKNWVAIVTDAYIAHEWAAPAGVQ